MTPEERWTYRQRIRDPRFPALILLVAAGAFLGAVVLGYDWGAVVFVVVLGVAMSLLALPPWRDPKHGPLVGAFVLGGATLLTLVFAWLLL